VTNLRFPVSGDSRAVGIIGGPLRPVNERPRADQHPRTPTGTNPVSPLIAGPAVSALVPAGSLPYAFYRQGPVSEFTPRSTRRPGCRPRRIAPSNAAMTASPSESELLAACRGGASSLSRERAWDMFVQRYARLVRAVVRRTADRLGLATTPEDCEDMAADVFVELLRADAAVLARYEGRASFAAYLAVVARRLVIRRVRARHRLVAPQPIEPATEGDARQVDDREDLPPRGSQLRRNQPHHRHADQLGGPGPLAGTGEASWADRGAAPRPGAEYVRRERPCDSAGRRCEPD